jgi:cell division protein FtsN
MTEIRISHRPVRATVVVLALAATLLLVLVAALVQQVSNMDSVSPTTDQVGTSLTCPLTAAEVWRRVQAHESVPQCHDPASMGGYPDAEALMP